jgi:hypothetical protein
VKDAEYRKTGRSGVYGGYQSWVDRPGRFRSPGTGKSILARCSANSPSTGMTAGRCWSECCLKAGETGAREGSEFIRRHIIPVSEHAFDDFAAGQEDRNSVRNMLGLGSVE